MKRRTKLDNRAIVMLLFGLVAIIAIMVQMRGSLPKPPPEIAQLAGERVGIVDSVYINLPFRFMIKSSSLYWRFKMLSQDSTFASFNTKENITDQIVWLVSGMRTAEIHAESAPRSLHSTNRDQGTTNSSVWAVANIGILSNDYETSSKNTAINLLADLIQKYESDGGRVRILQKVTSPAHQVLKGDYFVIVAPEQSNESWPVQIGAVLPRGDLFYIIFIKIKEPQYIALRGEVQEFIQRFHPLPTKF